MLTGKEIKHKRVEHNIKQVDLAKAINVTVPHLSNVESGKAPGFRARERATEYFKTLEK